MKVNRLAIRDFTVFGEADFEFSPGLNVLIGANGTGKSHVLKVLYSILRPMASVRSNGASNKNICDNVCERLGRPILDKVQTVFRPDTGRSPLTNLVRHGAKGAEVRADGDFGIVRVDLQEELATTYFERCIPSDDLAVFVPANEVLSMYPGFVAAYEKRELSFDETCRDLCVDLSASALKSVSPLGLEKIATTLDASVGGKTQLRGEKFFVVLEKEWNLEAPLLAEGLRKLGSIAHLIRNGSLTKKSVLFWDEPEANINPKLIVLVAQTLLRLAGAGVQVFIATHDFLLSHELSLAAQYETPEGIAAMPRFHCLSRRDASGPVAIEGATTLSGIPNNPILEEFAAHYDRERELFYKNDMKQGA